MSAIANQWTGNGLADGTTITSANVNTTGNGSTVSGGFTTGTATMVTEGDGFRVETSTTTAIRRIDCTISGTAVRVQVKTTIRARPATANSNIFVIRDGSTSFVQFYVTPAGVAGVLMTGIGPSGAETPALAVGDTVLVDLVVTQSASPTTTNGRVFYRLRNLTNTSWNTTGEFFFDSGYAVNAGTVTYTAVRFGKMQSETLPAPGLLYEFPGWETITVSPSDTSEAAAKTYFADAPTSNTPLATPVVALGTTTNPTTVGGSNGSQVVTWGAVSGATSYVAYRAPGNSPAQGDFVQVATAVTSPYTFTGLSAGTYSFGIRAKA
jgi:hypothetical protein